MPIVFYYDDISTGCAAVAFTADHLGIQLVKKYVDIDAGETMKPEFVKINPQHCVPTIDDDGFILWESRAIMLYLVNKYAPDSPLYPRDPKERALVDKMLYYDIGTSYRAFQNYYTPYLIEGKPLDPEKAKEFKAALSFLEKVLETSPYTAGEHLTLADYSILASLVFAEEILNVSYSDLPNISAWMQKMKEEIPKFKEIFGGPLKEYRKKLETSK